jgi:16S rRNA processing protein RimM
MEGAYLAVARLRKPHGLKGEVVVWVMTDDPERVLAPGRSLTPLDDEGRPAGAPVVIARSRPYHQEWLLAFEGVVDRTELAGWRQRVFGVPADALSPPEGDALYLHEVPGVRIVVGGREIGIAKELLDAGGVPLLAVDIGGREVLVPFRQPIVVSIDRAERRIVLDPPPGLLEL